MCVAFIRFSLTALVRSCKTGCGDSSIPSSGDVVVVVVVVLAVAVVADAIGVLAILDVVIIAIVKMVAAMKGFLLLFLLRR